MQENPLDSSQNIMEIINAFVENTKNIETIIVTISKSVEAISKKVDPKVFKKSKENMKLVVSGIQDYLGAMSDIINEMMNPKNGIKFDDDFAKTMLGFDKRLEGALKDIEAAGGENAKKNAEPIENLIELNKKSSIPQQILAFSSILGSLFGSFNKLGDSIKDPMAIVKFELAITIFKDELMEMIDMIVDSFKDIDINKLQGILDVLVSEPETVTNTMKQIDKGSKENHDLDITNTTTTKKGKQGLLDVITNVLNIFQVLTNLPVPTPGIFNIKLKIAMSCLNDMWDGIKEFTDKNNFNVGKIKAMDKSFETLISTYISIKTIAGHMKEIGKPTTWTEIKLARNAIETIFGNGEKEKSIFRILASLAENKGFIMLTSDDFSKKMTAFEKITKKVCSIAVIITAIGLLTVPLLLSFGALLVLKGIVKMLCWVFDEETLAQFDTAKEGVVKMSLLVLMLSSAVLLLSLTGLLIVEDWTNILYVGLFVLMLLGIFYTIGQIVKSLKEDKLDNGILYIAGAVLLLSSTALLLSLTGMLITEEWKNYLIVGAFVLLVVAVFFIIGLTVRLMKEFKADKGLLYIAGSIMLLSLSVILLALVGKLIKEEEDNIGTTFVLMLIIVGAFIGIGLFSKKIKGGSKAMLWIALSVAILVLIIYLMVPLSDLVDENYDKLKNLLYILGAIVIAFVIVAAFGTVIKKGAGILIIMGITLLMFSVSMYIMAMASQEANWKVLAVMLVGIIGIIAGTLIALSFAAPLITIGVALLLAIGASMLMFAISFKVIVDALEKIKSLNIDPKKDAGIIAMPIEIMWKAVESASEYNILTILEGVYKIGLLGDVALSLSNMADTIQKFAMLKIPTKFNKEGKPIDFLPMTDTEFAMAAKNIATILTFLITTVGDEEMTSLLENISKKATKNLKRLMESTSGVTELINAIEKAVKFKDEDIKTGIGNVKQLIEGFAGMMQQLFIGEGEWQDEEGWFGRKIKKFVLGENSHPIVSEDMLDDIEDIFEDLVELVKPTKELIEAMESMSSIDPKKTVNIGQAIQNFVTGVYGDATGKGGIQINPSTAFYKNQQLSYLIRQQERFANIKSDNLQRNVDNFVRFVDKANTIDSNKIKTVRDMFEQMAEFSKSVKGDFDKLADVLSEKLVEILEKLHITLEDISQREGGENVEGNATAERSATAEYSEKQETKEDKEKQKEQDLKEVVDSLDEITSILRNVRDNTEKNWNTF